MRMKITCPHCGGGTRCACMTCGDKHGHAGMCRGCHGKGQVTVASDARTWPHCGGGTRCACPTCGDGHGHAGMCHACHGKGRV